MKRLLTLSCVLSLAALIACAAYAQTAASQNPDRPTAEPDAAFLNFSDPPTAQAPEPATLAMIALGGSALFYPRRRARLYR